VIAGSKCVSSSASSIRPGLRCSELVAHAELGHLREEAGAAAAEGEPAQAWGPLRERLAEAQQLAERIVYGL
jgi:hypothetical protein